ncbi:MAG: caspase family protein [Chryseolinea sp.]
MSSVVSGLRFILFALFVVNGTATFAQFKLYEKGHDAYKAGNFPVAISSLSEYLTKPTRDKAMDVEVFYIRALAYYKSNNFRNAIGDFQETLLLNHPNKGNIYWFVAKSYDKENNVKEAINAYNYALRELDGNKDSKAKLLFERSEAHKRNNELPMAYLDLKNLLVLQPTNATARVEFEKLEKQGIKAPEKPQALASNNQPPTTQIVVQKESQPVVATQSTATRNTGTKAVGKNSINSKTDNKPVRPEEKVEVKSVATSDPVVKTPEAVVPAKPSLSEFFKDEKRYALVIGNSNYPKAIGMLKNPVNDATDFAKELQTSNFEVQLLTDATYGQMRAAMLKFKEKVDAGSKDQTVSLFYYAGHGLQREDENFLVPIDASVEYEDDIARYCFPVQRMVLSNMERSNSRMHIVILDACRNNPFPSLNRSLGDSGLGEMRRAMGSFIAYATAPGSVASDGTGRNGLYTQELIKAVRKPGLTIEQVFKDVRQNVLRLSGNKQNTWDSSNIIGEFYFKF